MFYLWHEAYDKNHPKFSVVKFQDKLGLQQYDRYEKLDKIIVNAKRDHDVITIKN